MSGIRCLDKCLSGSITEYGIDVYSHPLVRDYVEETFSDQFSVWSADSTRCNTIPVLATLTKLTTLSLSITDPRVSLQPLSSLANLRSFGIDWRIGYASAPPNMLEPLASMKLTALRLEGAFPAEVFKALRGCQDLKELEWSGHEDYPDADAAGDGFLEHAPSLVTSLRKLWGSRVPIGAYFACRNLVELDIGFFDLNTDDHGLPASFSCVTSLAITGSMLVRAARENQCLAATNLRVSDALELPDMRSIAHLTALDVQFRTFAPMLLNQEGLRPLSVLTSLRSLALTYSAEGSDKVSVLAHIQAALTKLVLTGDAAFELLQDSRDRHDSILTLKHLEASDCWSLKLAPRPENAPLLSRLSNLRTLKLGPQFAKGGLRVLELIASPKLRSLTVMMRSDPRTVPLTASNFNHLSKYVHSLRQLKIQAFIELETYDAFPDFLASCCKLQTADVYFTVAGIREAALKQKTSDTRFGNTPPTWSTVLTALPLVDASFRSNAVRERSPDEYMYGYDSESDNPFDEYGERVVFGGNTGWYPAPYSDSD